MRLAAVFALIALFAGCNSYRIVQKNVFSDDLGRIVSVDYARAEHEHNSKFTSPVTGKEIDFKSRLLVNVELYDGEKFKAWQCMNFSRNGTMYKTDNQEYMFLAGGFTCNIYKLVDDGLYDEIYRGVICDSPAPAEEQEQDKWRLVKPQKKGFRNGTAR